MADSLAIIGVGLIGGSIGLAARRAGGFGPVIGVGRDSAGLETARRLGCVDEITTDLTDGARRADVIIVCTPVDVIAGQVLAAAAQCKPGALITDAGSTKVAIVRAVEDSLPRDRQFVGSHPLAGSEKRGPENARADLFDNRLTLITPTDRTPPAAAERAAAFWRALGSRVLPISPEYHDEALALTSHLPHLVAAALAGILPREMAELTATGFRDTTRLAASDAGLWSAILGQNSGNIARALRQLQDRLTEFETALRAGDTNTLNRLLVQAKETRDDLGNQH